MPDCLDGLGIAVGSPLQPGRDEAPCSNDLLYAQTPYGGSFSLTSGYLHHARLAHLTQSYRNDMYYRGIRLNGFHYDGSVSVLEVTKEVDRAGM